MIFKYLAHLVIAAFPLLVVVSAYETPQLEGRDTWSDQVLAAHNAARARYGAKPLQWSSNLYGQTLTHARQCKFAHSNSQSRYGENLYVSSNPSTSISDAVKSWTDEASKYDYSHPGFSGATGHFTQVVWKSTTQVACAEASCAAGTIFSQPSKFIVCRYTPPGNYQGQYPQNVGRRVA